MDGAISLNIYNDRIKKINLTKIISEFKKDNFIYIHDVNSSYTSTATTLAQIINLSYFKDKNNLQNFNQECKNYISLIRKNFRLNQIIQNFFRIKKKRVLVIGETIIDKYITTETIGKSGKESMLVLKPKKEIKFLGGAAYIANLCSSFIKDIKIISFLGKENTEKKFILKNLNKNIKYNFLLKKNSPTINKLRYLDDYKKTKIIGVYDLNDDLISKNEEKKFLASIKKNINRYDIILVGDYGHGIITEKIRKLILKNSDKVFLNTQINSFNRGYHTVFKYKKVNTLVINEYELRYELRDKHTEISKLAKILSKKISAKNIIVTRGIYGSVLINRKNNLVISCPAFYQNNIDTVGAGDTFFGICGMAIGSKVDNKISMLLGAITAGFAVEQIVNKFYYNFQTLKKHLTHIFK